MSQLNGLLDGFLLHLSKPSAQLIDEGNIERKEGKKGVCIKDSRLSAAHLFLIFILLFRAFARLVASNR